MDTSTGIEVSEGRSGTPTTTPRAGADVLPWPSLLALGAVTFVVVTGEMLPTAVLPQMSADLAVPQARTGLLVSLWAAAVALVSVPLARLTARFDRRRVIVAGAVAFAASSAGTAVANGFEAAVVARLLGAAACGLLWAVVNAHTAALVPERRLAQAVAVVVGGATLGTVVGVPAANLAARLADWRLAFAAVAVAGLVVAATVALVVRPASDVAAPDPAGPDAAGPAVAAPDAAGRAAAGATAAGPAVATPLRAPRPAPRRLRVVVALATAIAVTLVGHFAAYTFVTSLLADAAGAFPGGTSGLLLLLGGTSAAGVVVVTRIDHARLGAALVVSGVLVAAAVVALPASGGGVVAATLAVAVWGLASGAVPPLAQTMVMATAGPELRGVAGALVPVTFNAAIAIGAAGGAAVVGGWGVDALPAPAAAAVLLGAVGLAAVLRLLARPADPA